MLGWYWWSWAFWICKVWVLSYLKSNRTSSYHPWFVWSTFTKYWNMSIRWILDFSCISKFREGASKQPEMLGGRSIRIQEAQYSYLTNSKRSWPPISTQHSYKSHTSPHKVPEKHILWVFSMAHSSSGWVLILSNFFGWKIWIVSFKMPYRTSSYDAW